MKKHQAGKDNHPRQCPLTFAELVGLSQYLLSRLGDNWHLAVTAAAAVGKKKKPTMGKRVRSGSHLLDPAHTHVNEKITATGWLRAWTSVVTLSGSCAFFLKHEWGDWGGTGKSLQCESQGQVPSPISEFQFSHLQSVVKKWRSPGFVVIQGPGCGILTSCGLKKPLPKWADDCNLLWNVSDK